MKCEGCGAELVAGAAKCGACGRAVGMGQRTAGESAKVAKEVGQGAEKVGKGLWSGVKSLEQKAKKEFKHGEEPPKQA